LLSSDILLLLLLEFIF